MGLLNLLRSLKKDENEARILVLGLDNAGKTTILKAMSEEDVTSIMPTQGFNIKALVSDSWRFHRKCADTVSSPDPNGRVLVKVHFSPSLLDS